MPDLAKAYQLPAMDEWEVQLLDTLLTVGFDMLNKAALGRPITLDSILAREYVALVVSSGNLDFTIFARKISELADQARRDTGRLT